MLFRVLLLVVAVAASTAYLPRAAQLTTTGLTVPITIHGVVAGSYFLPPNGATPSSTTASYYRGATVCLDANKNAGCDPGEASAVTDDLGRFTLTGSGPAALAAEIPATATNAGRPVGQRTVFRAAAGQVAGGGTVAVTPLSTEIVRLIECKPCDYDFDYAAARRHLAARLTVPIEAVTADPNAVTDPTIRTALLTESVILSHRFELAAKMVDRHDVSPDALARDPQAKGPAMTMREAEQAAMTLEDIPRYDHIFIIVMENKDSFVIRHSPFAPNINRYLDLGNQFVSYNATARPSEPNRVAMIAGDDFGITDNDDWNCVPSGDTADLPEDPLPPGMSPCTNATSSHNIKNRPNLLTAMRAAGMTWRVYSESRKPGRDPRLDGAADPTILARDHLYSAGSPVGAIGNPSLQVSFPARLYATKHNGSIPFQSVRSAPDFFSNNRTMGGGQWDDALRAIAPPGWDVDQLGTDLWSGDVGNLNYLEPDQCDDMHGVTVTGTIGGTQVPASDCTGDSLGDALIYRGDLFIDALIRKIQASPVWTNTAKRTAIVIAFDEGDATTGLNSCCGWNPVGKPGYGTLASLGPLVRNADGSVSIDTTIANYRNGNRGHGAAVFGVLSNQPDAPEGVVDSDAYSHFSFVRTLQDMFGLADPGDPWSYMNRSKYTETFIAENLARLPEYSISSDSHFDAVRPMNHRYVIPAGYVQKTGVTSPGPHVGPDVNQVNPWALRD